MGKINIDELNEQIANYDLEGLYYQPIYTPQLSSLPVKKSKKNICSHDTIHYVRKRFVHNQFPEDREISEDLYPYICDFILGENISNEEKIIVSKYLNEELKQMIFKKYLETEFKYKNFKTDPDDLDKTLWYTPKINSVPLKNYDIDKKYNIIYSKKIELNYERFIEIINGKGEKLDAEEILSIRNLINSDSYFTSPWCPNNIKIIVQKLNTSVIKKFENEFCDKNDKLMKQDVVNSDANNHQYHASNILIDEIFNSIPKDFSLLEKTIYIYAKLCKILSYDPVYFFNNKSLHHTDVSNINNYDLKNNNVVCYEFSYILSDLLRKIGVTAIKEQKVSNNQFSNSHTNITYLVDDLVIFADSTRTIIEGDLTQLKFLNEFNGIRCELYNEDSQIKFHQAMDKVKSYLDNEDRALSTMLPSKETVENLTYNERMQLFNNYLINCNLTNTNFISYAKKLQSLLDLNITTKTYYDNENKSKILLYVEFDAYESNNKNKISYLIDSVNKEIYNQQPDDFTYFEDLTSRRHL